ncbi:carboxypeptidase-like regulatory domain-containing protein [Rufibacter psychrotolerans]|uniref:carboxypeptidase-like regulatory domain-containing protein n=1 Tax=Rufibacter psychrotolerans TaxID=2812556 RepID=UPI001966D2ED|nr:carboxypeptidase-like regulatory domain-containing protein [Rufibacter sp. SYSU D00308]
MPFLSPTRSGFFWCLALLVLLLGQGGTARGQAGSVSGTVIDAQTKQPLGFATVFIAQTTYGTNTAENGTFRLNALPAGSHELVVSFLGYSTLSHQFTLQPGQQLSFRFELVPAANVLQEVVIRPDTNWRHNYGVFLQHFIGQTANAAKTSIANAEALHFQFDPRERVLTAEASEPLIIENKALGYRVHFVLKEFRADFKGGQIFHAGFPRFEEIKPRGKAQQKRWAQARLKAYHGSLMHFVRALYQNRVEAEGFNVRRLQRLPNPSRPPEEQIQAGLRRARRLRTGPVVIKSLPTGPEDSLQYWTRMARLDKVVAYLYKDPIPYHQIIAPDSVGQGRLMLRFPDYLNVVYTKEQEEPGFVNQQAFNRRRAPTFQTSLLTLLEPYTFIEPNGMIINPYSHLVEGYWGFEKLAEMLPLDYTP